MDLKNIGNIAYEVGGTTVNLASNEIITVLNADYSATLSLTASPETYSPGDIITFQADAINTNTGTLFNPVITHALTGIPLSYVPNSATAFLYDDSTTPPTGTPLAITETSVANTSISFEFPTELAAKESIILTYDMQVATTGTIPNSISSTDTFTANQASATGSVLTATATEVITRETFSIVKSSSPATVNPGDTLTYTFVLENLDSTAVTVKKVTDPLPSNYTVTGVTVKEGATGTPATYTKDTDYSVDTTTNELTIAPATATTQKLNVPAATGTAPNITPGTITITITGTVNA